MHKTLKMTAALAAGVAENLPRVTARSLLGRRYRIVMLVSWGGVAARFSSGDC
jgi:hypothetical protein